MSVYLSVGEGLIRSIAVVDAALYDKTVPRNAGIGRICNRTINQTLHAVVRGTSNATLRRF